MWRKYQKKKMPAVEATVQRVEEVGSYRPKRQPDPRVKQFLLIGVTNGSAKGVKAGKPERLLLC